MAETLTVSVIAELRRFISGAHLVEHDSKGPHIDLWAHETISGLHLRSNVTSGAAALGH